MAKKYFSFMVLLCLLYYTNLVDALTCINNQDNIAKMMCCLFIGILLSLILFNITKYFNMPFPYRVVVLCFGAIFGVIAKFHPSFEAEIEHNIMMKPKLIFMIIVPILIFRISFNLDIHTFVRSWVQIFVLAGPGFILSSCFTGLLMMLLIPEFSFAMAILFGCICTAIYPIEIIELLNEVGQFKPLTVLLQGESVIGDGTVLILFALAFGVIKGVLSTWYQICLVFLRFSIGGIIWGYTAGSVLVFLMRTIHNDIVTMAMLPLAASFTTFYVASESLNVSAIISIVVLGIKTGMEKTSMPAETETFLTNFWNLLAHCVDTVVCIISGLLVVKLFSFENIFRDNALVLVTYIVSTTSRVFSYILLTPIVSRFGYGLTFKEMVIAVWSGLKGPLPLLLSLIANQPTTEIGRDVLFHISSLMVLTLLINASCMPYVLKILGVSEVYNRRDRTIATLKMDRFLSDANWSVVNETTEIKHPYKIDYSDSDDESDILFYNRPIVCPDCKKEIAYEPTKKEMAAMLREARLRILKAKKMSYTRQYESGMLSKDGIRILLQAIEVAMDTPDALIELDGLRRYFKRQGFMHYARRKLLVQFFKNTNSPVKPPRRYWRKICYNIVTNTVFELLLHFCVVVHTILTCFELLNSPARNSDFSIVIIVTNVSSFLIFFMEFVLKILAFSWVYICKHGFKAYFTSYWNIFDFICLLVLFVDVIFIAIDLLCAAFDKYELSFYTIVLIAELCRIIRLIRILTLCKGLYPKLILYCDSKIDEHSAFAYDIGKGVVTGEEEVTSFLAQMIDNTIIRDLCRARIEDDRLIITKDLGIIQKDKPWIAITVKTRQAARSTLNSMQDAVQELKLSGTFIHRWHEQINFFASVGGVDDFEYMKLMRSFEDSFKRIRSKLKSVQPSSPKEMFKEVPWMTGNDEVCNYLYNNVITKVFDQGDVVCVDGDLSDNIYVLVIGIFKLSYIPKTNILDRLSEYGALPVIDYISSPLFQERIQDYILSGNCVGELSVLTNRPYDCTIIAESASQAYVLSKDVMQNAFLLNSNILNGLEAKMWKAISIRLATTILMETPAYQSSTLEHIKFCLERAFVPKLINYKVFYVNDLIEDVILLEGVIWDWNTKNRYTAPCYIPRTVQKIMFPRSMNFITTVETKLLIIPAKDVIDYDIMNKLDDVSEMISIASSRCLKHVIQNKISRRKRKIGPQEYYRKNKLSTIKPSDSRSYDGLSKSEDSTLNGVELQCGHSFGQASVNTENRDNKPLRNSFFFKNTLINKQSKNQNSLYVENRRNRYSKVPSLQRDREYTKSFMSHLLNNVESGTYLKPDKSENVLYPGSNTETNGKKVVAKLPDAIAEEVYNLNTKSFEVPDENKASTSPQHLMSSKKFLKPSKGDSIRTEGADSETEIAAVDLTNAEKLIIPKTDEHN